MRGTRNKQPQRTAIAARGFFVSIISYRCLRSVDGFAVSSSTYLTPNHQGSFMQMARTSFEAVPGDDGGEQKNEGDELDQKLNDLVQSQQDILKPLSTTSDSALPIGKLAGFALPKSGGKKTKNALTPPKTYTAIGAPPINNINKPEYDKDGYMLYTNEQSGEKSRVFEALIEYPCEFKVKIVGKDEGTFVSDMVEMVTTTCKSSTEFVSWNERKKGQWTSITIAVPVQNAEMLYELYENIDADPRVRFKF